MKTNLESQSSKPALTIQITLTDGSVHSFIQTDKTKGLELWKKATCAQIFGSPRLIIGSAHSKAVFVSAEILRIDFLNDTFDRLPVTEGYSDIVELTEAEFRKHAHLDEPKLMALREQPVPTGDLFVSFLQLQMKGCGPIFLMVEFPVKLRAESHSFMQFLLSKTSFQMRLHSGGHAAVNLANLLGYTVYPGIATVPADAWIAEPVPTTP